MSPELIAEKWVNGYIDDDEFLASVEHMIKNDVITVKSDSITKTSQLPDWLVNNAGWWAARILTNSDFNFDSGYAKEEFYPCIENSDVTGLAQTKKVNHECFESSTTYNSYGFRGNEFEKEKPDNTFRIFTVGGSSTFGSAAFDNETWPAHLQQVIKEKITGEEIEVINFGLGGARTDSEYELIKNKLLSFDPDLIIMYYGWNDAQYNLALEKTIQNWESVCKLGKEEGFDTIIIVQPLPITGHRVLTNQEIGNSFKNLTYLQKSQQYVDAFEELDTVCTKTADFRRIFDYIQEPVFYDDGHTMSFGNKIIAKNVFSVISPIYFGKTYSVTLSLHTEKNESGAGVVYAVGSDLSNRNFDNLNLQNAIFDKADLSNTSFKNTNIDGARFVFANLSNSNLLDRTDLSNVNLAGTDLSNVSLKGTNLSSAILTGTDLTGVILTGSDLTGTMLARANLTGAILKDVDLSGKDLSGTNFFFTDLRSSDLSGTILSDSILFRTNLSKIDLRTAKLDNVDFRFALLSESKFPDSSLVDNNFNFAHLSNINFAGKDLSGSSFDQTAFDGSDMQNTNLGGASFVQVDFTKIKNKSLAGADLTTTSLAHSNLSGVNLSGTILVGSNFWKANLSGVDFTVVSNATIEGSTFIETNLSDSNFEGADLSPQEMFFHIFKNKAYLMRDQTQSSKAEENMRNDLFGTSHTLILSSEIRGNDLAVYYIYYNNFAGANLENTNFKNATLWNASFYSANLTSADLSGADLRDAFLVGADLSNANLDGANLDGAILDNAILSNANLKCLNHPICESG